MIVVGTQATLARIGIGPINAAVGATALATRYYRKLDPGYGAAMGAVLGATCARAPRSRRCRCRCGRARPRPVRRRLGAPVPRPLLRRPQARVPRRSARPARRPAVPRRRGRVRARTLAGAARRGRASRRTDALGQGADAVSPRCPPRPSPTSASRARARCGRRRRWMFAIEHAYDSRTWPGAPKPEPGTTATLPTSTSQSHSSTSVVEDRALGRLLADVRARRRGTRRTRPSARGTSRPGSRAAA